jgi:Tfp pilus assembly protein PilF
LSLLLDALKRAEQEKLSRRGEGVAPAPAPAPMLREAPPPRAVASAASLELQPIAPAGGGAAGAAPRSDAHTAQVVFQSKAANAEKGRGMLWATLGAVAVVAIAAGAYVWYSVSSLTPQATYQPRPRPAAAPMASPGGSSPVSTTPAAEAQLAAALSSPPVTAEPAKSAPPAAAAVPAPVAAPKPREDAIASLLRESSAGAAPEPLRLDRSAPAQNEVPPAVTSGYDALRQGNLAAARRGYEAALATHPTNVDALLGLATVEARSGRRAAAFAQYRRALDIDPRNATALAGLAALADFARPEPLEAQLRADLARAPDAAPLHFTLGNVLAAQSRWNEAQAEYFEAHRLDPGSPEVMLNLAVSLDRMGQPRAAAGLYRRALEAVQGQSAPFDEAAVRRRLAEIR